MIGNGPGQGGPERSFPEKDETDPGMLVQHPGCGLDEDGKAFFRAESAGGSHDVFARHREKPPQAFLVKRIGPSESLRIDGVGNNHHSPA
jgi:hypothetical protein